ncbi:MAG TPA: hypothetical protein VFO16_15415 [Pseudonocardiaceae bacterium]|nr:hypothetical protein [Pseudonocardiaceae bacterium]
MTHMAGMPGMGEHAQHPSGDPPGSHTMIAIGTGQIFLSHLPMFMKPHDYQVILQASFGGSHGDPQRVYVDDRKAHPDVLLYTLRPEKFVLPDLFPPAPGEQAHRRSFQADLFRGNFEQPATNPVRIAANVVVSVESVVLGRKFIPGAPGLDRLAYVLFGKGSELWLAHVITKPPDFDQILSTAVGGHTFTDQELISGIPITIPGQKNAAAERIELSPADPAIDALASDRVPVELRPQAEFYFNDNEDLR